MKNMLIQAVTPKWQLKVIDINVSIFNEIIAGVSVFLTMAYIILVNPMILSKAGIPFNSSFFATCTITALGCFSLGLITKMPIAIGPSMVINSYFVTNIVNKFSGDWQSALGAVFLSGVFICIAAIYKLPAKIKRIIVPDIMKAIIVAIALLIATVAVETADLTKNANLKGFILTGSIFFILNIYKIKGAGFISIIVGSITVNNFWSVTALDYNNLNILNNLKFLPSFNNVWLTLTSSLTLAFLIICDSYSTIIALTDNNQLKNTKKFEDQKSSILMISGISSILSSIFGSSNIGVYFESAVGLSSKAITGWCTIIVGICFLLALLFFPYIQYIPTVVPAAVLFIIALQMLTTAKTINWQQPKIAIPVVITIGVIVACKAIAYGICLGVLSHWILNRNHMQLSKQDMILYLFFIIYLLIKIIETKLF